MILESLDLPAEEFERRSGWSIEARGGCRDGRCVPLPPMPPGRVDVRAFAARLKMPIVGDEGAWCLGPESGGCALSSDRAPDLRLPDWRGREFRLTSVRGRKTLLVAWASW
jgi:hypothetical protein